MFNHIITMVIYNKCYYRRKTMALKKISKDEIIKGAFNYIKEYGLANFNARSLAKYLKCSTQPIYFQFEGLDKLKSEVLEMTKKDYYTYIWENLKYSDSLFMGSMKSMIMYAKNYKNLYKFMFQEKFVQSETDEQFRDEIVKGIMKLGGYPYEDAIMFFNQSWIFTYGIASSIINGYMIFTDDEIIELLENQFSALKAYYRRG